MTENNQPELKPLNCPFCGEPSPLELGHMYEERFKFQCVSCKAAGPTHRTLPAAIEAWNTRALDSLRAPVSGELEELRKDKERLNRLEAYMECHTNLPELNSDNWLWLRAPATNKDLRLAIDSAPSKEGGK